MPTQAECLAHAEEAERLAEVVSYKGDRTRLIRQAAEWRERAAAAAADGGKTAEAKPPSGPARGSIAGLLAGLVRRIR